jgi:hypothetical protein
MSLNVKLWPRFKINGWPSYGVMPMYNIIGIFKVDIPLCDSMITIQVITINTTKFWCLLKQHVSTHVGYFQAKQM